MTDEKPTPEQEQEDAELMRAAMVLTRVMKYGRVPGGRMTHHREEDK